jgi:hypothetical protein
LTNLVVNGDFEAGNTGFTSDYRYSPGDIGPDTVYDLLRNPADEHYLGASYGDHTSGSGLMMAVNGARYPNFNAVVWSESLSVTPKHLI